MTKTDAHSLSPTHTRRRARGHKQIQSELKATLARLPVLWMGSRDVKRGGLIKHASFADEVLMQKWVVLL